MKLKVRSRLLHGECGSDLQIRTGHFDHFGRADQNSPRTRTMGTSVGAFRELMVDIDLYCPINRIQEAMLASNEEFRTGDQPATKG